MIRAGCGAVGRKSEVELVVRDTADIEVVIIVNTNRDTTDSGKLCFAV